MPLSATLDLIASIGLTKVDDLVTGAAPTAYKKSYKLTDGTGANQAKNVFSDQRTLAASASEELDLAGTLLNIYGATLAFAKIKALIVFAAAANTNDVQVGGSAANGFNAWVGAVGDLVKVRPGGLLMLVAPDVNGYAVTAGTGDLLKIANGGAGSSVTYDIIAIGTE